MTRAMAALLAVVVIGGLVAVVASRPSPPAAPAYTVIGVLAGVAHAPRAWAGRTVLVRGTAFDCDPRGNGDCGYQYWLAPVGGGALLPVTIAPDTPAIRFLRRLPLIGPHIPGLMQWNRPATYRVRIRPIPRCRFTACWEGLVLARTG